MPFPRPHGLLILSVGNSFSSREATGIGASFASEGPRQEVGGTTAAGSLLRIGGSMLAWRAAAFAGLSPHRAHSIQVQEE
jgi:hypothetical protein